MQEISDLKTSSNTIAHSGINHDKRTSLKQAVQRYLNDGIDIGIGGFANTRIPVASIHEIIRQGAHNLVLSIQSSSICSELLAGAMILNPEHLSIRHVKPMIYGKQVIGAAPLLKYLTDTNAIEIADFHHHDILHDSTVEEPLQNKQHDLALIHVQEADIYGNSKIYGDRCVCLEIAENSTNTIITTEQITQDSPLQQCTNQTQIPSHIVDALVDQPFGATPGACSGNYWFNMSEILDFIEISENFIVTGDKKSLQDYYNRQIFDMRNFDDFLEQKPYPVLQKICQLDGGQPTSTDSQKMFDFSSKCNVTPQ